MKIPTIKIDTINLNTVLVFGAVIGVIFIAYKIKGAFSSASDAYAKLDLNPFDAGSLIPTTINKVTDSVTAAAESILNGAVIKPSAGLTKAFADKGLSIYDYKLFVGGGRTPIPTNAIYIQVGRFGNYYVPKYGFLK